jgi:hypothetical protein
MKRCGERGAEKGNCEWDEAHEWFNPEFERVVPQYLDFSELPESVSKVIIELHPGVTGEGEVARILQDFGALGFTRAGREGDTWLLLRWMLLRLVFKHQCLHSKGWGER